MDMTTRKKLPTRRRKNRGVVDEDEIEREPEAIILGDDCETIADDAKDNEENGITVEEEACETLSTHFGDIASNEKEESDESGDDIWNDDTIPDPLSSDDEEEEARRESREDRVGADELLALRKTFSSASEFKQALLRYSLKARYDIKLYISTQKKLGAICSGIEYSCPWRVYCSYEKSKHEMQIKVFVNEHICVRSGYSNMLKSSSIAQQFAERLRMNPKLTARDIEEEIKRNYNLTVTEEQCRQAKTKIIRERRASHEARFSRIWDYEAEIHDTNPCTIMEIHTIPPTQGSKQRFDRIYMCFNAKRVAWKST